MRQPKLLLLLICLTFLISCGARKKSYTLHGVVEGVDPANKTLKVNHQAVPGWMEAMTMDYEVKDPAVLDRIHKGDTITATVYEDDYRLYEVQRVAQDEKAPPR